MKAQAFLNLVGKMMTAQQDYFKQRGTVRLIAAKELEKLVQSVVKEGKLEPDEPQPTVHVYTTEEYQRQLDFIEQGEKLSLPDIENFGDQPT